MQSIKRVQDIIRHVFLFPASLTVVFLSACPAMAQDGGGVSSSVWGLTLAVALLLGLSCLYLYRKKSDSNICSAATTIAQASSEESLRLERETLRRLLGKAPVGVAIISEGIVRWTNPIAAEMVDLMEGGKGDAAFVDKEDAVKVNEILETRGLIHDMAIQMYDAGGKIKDIYLTAVTTEFATEPSHMFWMVDISNLKRTEKALTEAHFSAEAAMRAKSDFLARMSHEIRTPMNAILGMSHLCLQTKLTHKQRDHITKVQDAAQMLLGVINDILDFSKAGSDSISLEKSPFHLDIFLNSVDNPMIQRAEKKGLRYHTEIAPDVPNRLVGDSLRISQVLQILIGNAIKFTEQGEVLLKVETSADDTAWTELHFSVRDTGIGIEQDQLENLFLPFVQGDDSATRRFGGTGLGLAISRSLIDLMGGKIWAESTLGQGSTFHFTLHLDKEVRGPSHIPTHLEFDEMEVIVVEEEEQAAEILLREVRSLGFKTLFAPNGMTALNLMEQMAAEGRHASVLLLNWTMDGLDGIETAHLIQSSFPPDEVPLMILISASEAEVPKELLQVNGIGACLSKPLNAEILKKTICRLLGKDAPDACQGLTNDEVAPAASILGARVLLVEDNEINQEIAIALLENEGMNVDIANNGEEALAMVNNAAPGTFQLVFMDIQMPVMDGLTAAREIRQAGHERESLPIVAMTAHARETDKEHSMEAGMNDHITKPLDPEILHSTLEKWIDPTKIPTGSTPPKREEDPERLVTPDDVFYTATGQKITLEDGQLPELSRQAGLESVGGNQALYAKLLRKFQESCKTSDTDITTAMEEGNAELGIRLAHTVKGVSASLGMIALSQIAASIERSLKELAPGQEINHTLMDRFSHELSHAMAAVHEYLVESGQDQEPLAPIAPDAQMNKLNDADAAQALKLLQQLASNLEADWGAVMGAHEQIIDILRESTSASDLYNLTVAIENFDVPQARAAAQKIVDTLQDSPSEAN